MNLPGRVSIGGAPIAIDRGIELVYEFPPVDYSYRLQTVAKSGKWFAYYTYQDSLGRWYRGEQIYSGKIVAESDKERIYFDAHTGEGERRVNL